MKDKLFKISNQICRCFKYFCSDIYDDLLTLQLFVLSLFFAKTDENLIKAKFDVSELNKIGLGIQFSVENLENLVNSGYFASVIEIVHEGMPVHLIKGAICVDTVITCIFNPDLLCEIMPTDDYSLFALDDLLNFRNAGGLALYMLLTAEQNEAGVQSGASFTPEIDFDNLCKVLGLRYSKESRPGRKIIDRFFKRTLPDIRSGHPEIKLSYQITKDGVNPRSPLSSAVVCIHVSGLKTEGVNGLSHVEVIDEGVPWFKDEIGRFLSDMITSNHRILFEKDSMGRCTAATTLVTGDRVISTAGMKSTRITPLGYEDVISSCCYADLRYRVARSHIIARRLSGPDEAYNLITATVYLNTQMARVENTVSKYVQASPDTAAVLYRVEPVYEGRNPIPRKIRIGALSIDQSENSLSIYVEILNAECGILLDSIIRDKVN